MHVQSCQAAIILQVHATFNYIDENGENLTHTVNNHRSWRMTKLFISPITATTDCTPFYTQHEAIWQLVCSIFAGGEWQWGMGCHWMVSQR